MLPASHPRACTPFTLPPRPSPTRFLLRSQLLSRRAPLPQRGVFCVPRVFLIGTAMAVARVWRGPDTGAESFEGPAADLSDRGKAQ
jgi:hypothetical protein